MPPFPGTGAAGAEVLRRLVGWSHVVPFAALLAAIASGQSALTVSAGAPATTTAGDLSIDPAVATAGAFGTWTVTYVVGPAGIAENGGIRVQLPDAFHSGPRNSANRLQASDPADDHYISARCSRGDVELRTNVEGETREQLVKHARQSLDGRAERYVFVVRVRLIRGELREGDHIEVTYGDRSQGSRGLRAAEISFAPRPVLLALDADGSERFALHEGRAATIRSVPGPPVELMLHVATHGVVGESLVAKVAAVDRLGNPVAAATPFEVAVVTGEAAVPTALQLTADRGVAQFPLTPAAAGIVRLRATAPEWELAATSNPLVVTGRPLERHVFWGDLHSHTGLSWDGVGDRQFWYARWVSGLDFYARTDHAVEPDRQTHGLSAASWPRYVAETDAHDRPGEFVTLHGYECSMGKPWGHHNVYFRGAPGPLVYPGTGLAELWSRLERGDALTIPHHTGKFPAGIRFEPHDDELRRNFEVYSGHGLSEAHDPEHPLSFERSDFTSPSTSLKHPSFAQDAWRLGLRLSTIASSDDHRAQPGKPHYGLVAVQATELSRDAIFQALYDRRTYATTGAKILLEFSVEGAAMGQSVALDGAADVAVRAVGTDVIDLIEVLRWLPGEPRFEVVHTWRPGQATFAAAFADPAAVPSAIYYMRLRQRNLVRGLPVMAWSSPVWVEGGTVPAAD